MFHDVFPETETIRFDATAAWGETPPQLNEPAPRKRRNRAGVKAAKIELADYIAKKAGLPNLMDTSPCGMSRFTIWNFRLSPRGGKKKTP